MASEGVTREVAAKAIGTTASISWAGIKGFVMSSTKISLRKIFAAGATLVNKRQSAILKSQVSAIRAKQSQLVSEEEAIAEASLNVDLEWEEQKMSTMPIMVNQGELYNVDSLYSAGRRNMFMINICPTTFTAMNTKKLEPSSDMVS